MIDLLFLHGTDSRIEDFRTRVLHVHARSQARIAGDLKAIHAETTKLRQDVDELALFTRALTTLLVEKGVITHDELVERVVEVDREDGVEDGRMGPSGPAAVPPA